jgi:hypothetical protein
MAQGNVATPFLEMPSFVSEETDSFAAEAPPRAIGSPFLAVYELDGQSEFADPEREAYASFVQDLYDEEFDEALYELMTSARGLHEEHMVSNSADTDGERILRQHFSQLVREAEATVSAFEREFGSRDLNALNEREVDSFAERYSPAGALEPEFEEFLGKWGKKLAGVVKKAAGFVKKGIAFASKIGLGPVLAKIKALVKPMLEKVLQMAIGRLPEAVRPAAQQLAARIFGTPAPEGSDGTTAGGDASATAPAADAGAVQASAAPDVTQVQQELDQQLANLFMASDEVEMELEIARARDDERQASVPVYAELDQAREHFIDELQNLREGEDPAPHIQNFLPAVLPALRLGVRLIGRPKVVGFLANLLAKVIAKLIGPEAAPALSRAIVDTGLKMLTLEVSPQDEQRVAASSVAATVEEAARRISALPDYVLDNQELLEGFALEAFERAAAANLPPVLSDAVYRDRPDLLESASRTAWVMLPLQRRKRYKKCSRTFRVRITPHMSEEIESFEGPLADYLHDQLGIEEGAEVEAEVHLYETLPGTMLPDIAREESEALKPAQLHPLTKQAAGLLLGEPRMGRPMLPNLSRRNVGAGLRLYSLAIPGKRILTVLGPNGKPQPRRLGGVRVILDGARDEIRVCMFLSEVKAQRLVLRLRRQSHAGSVAAAFQKYLAPRLALVLRGERPRNVRLIQAGVTSAASLRRLPADAAAALIARLSEALVTSFADFAKTQSQRIVAASEDTADGITIRFIIARPAGLQQLFKALQPNGQPGGVADAILRGTRPDVRIEVEPGYKCE